MLHLAKRFLYVISSQVMQGSIFACITFVTPIAMKYIAVNSFWFQAGLIMTQYVLKELEMCSKENFVLLLTQVPCMASPLKYCLLSCMLYE